VQGAVLDPDPDGVDPEGLAVLSDGTFWVSDEYGPDLIHVDRGGRTLERLQPGIRNRQGRALPRVLAMRRPNRGIEGLTITPDGRTLVSLMQSSLDNPTSSVRSTAVVTRLLMLDLASGRTRQVAYVQEAPGLSNSAITALSSTTFLVLERDERFAGDSTAPARYKRVYRIETQGATDVGDPEDAAGGKRFAGRTLEQLTADELEAAGIAPVTKVLVVDLLALPGGYPHDKPEGLVVIDDRMLAVSNDDDFRVTSGGGGTVVPKTLRASDRSLDYNEVRFVRLPSGLGGAAPR
jgi:hypothetical protein